MGVHLPRELLVNGFTEVVYRSTPVTPRGSQRKLTGYGVTENRNPLDAGQRNVSLLLRFQRMIMV